jgi:hypothetical protein
MKPWTLGPLALIFATLPLPGVAASDNGSVKQQLQAVSDRWARAWVKEDLRATAALYAPDYIGKEVDGKTYNRSQWMAVMKNYAAIQRLDRADVQIGKVTSHGKTAVSDSVYTDHGAMRDPRGKEHPETTWERFQFTWKKTPKGWVIHRARALELRVTIDGKRVDPNRPFG